MFGFARSPRRHSLVAMVTFALMALAGNAVCGVVTYGYDSLGRVVIATYPDGACVGFQYDAAGNRTQYVSGSTGAPTANPVSITTFEDLSVKFDPRLNVSSCTPLTVSAVGTPGHGSASIVTGGVGITYTPAAGYVGTDAFTYTISNGTQTGTGNVAATITAPTLPPVALNGIWQGIYIVQPGVRIKPIIVQSVSPFVSDPYGYALTVSAVTQGKLGTVGFNGLNITYSYNTTVGANVTKADSFNYTISDGHGFTASAVGSVDIETMSNQ